MNPAIRFILALLMTFYIIIAVPALALAGILLMHAETWPGRLFARGRTHRSSNPCVVVKVRIVSSTQAGASCGWPPGWGFWRRFCWVLIMP
ncbi:MAG: hypothetical protein U1F77_20030 [Kiritimatiellia bacterium]